MPNCHKRLRPKEVNNVLFNVDTMPQVQVNEESEWMDEQFMACREMYQNLGKCKTLNYSYLYVFRRQ